MKQICRNLEFEKLDEETARAAYETYECVIAHMISDLQYGKREEVTVNWEELLDLRAFDAKGELHVFDRNGTKSAVRITETGEPKDSLVKYCKLRNGMNLMVKEYLEPDEDGQAVVKYTRPFAMWKGGKHGAV